jgi:hypothetical protein
MPKIFISYRRDDSGYEADRLFQALRKHVANPKRDLFLDTETLPAGVNFVEHLDRTLGECDVLLAIIGSRWLGAIDPKTGGRRLDNPKDFVRMEIALALKRGIPVAPVLLDGTTMPTAEELPEGLKELALRNGVEVRRRTFDADTERLIEGLALEELDRKARIASVLGRQNRGVSGPLLSLIALGTLSVGGALSG